jgi:regulator of protease activity HflC (stomatin/prohibitin superfamily)
MRHLVLLIPFTVGCAGTTIQPGQRGLLFDPSSGGLKREVLQPGYHSLTSCFLKRACQRIEVFDVSYQTKKERVGTTSSEGLTMEVDVAVNYRPIIAELYELNTEIGQNYYEDIVSPEFKSASMGVFARYSHTQLKKLNEKIEDEIEADLRRRIKGKHVEISSVNIENVHYSPDIAAAIEAKLVAEQNAAKNKAALEAEALRKKMELEYATEQAKLKADLDVKAKKAEAEIAEAQAHIDKTKAETSAAIQVTHAKAEAESKKVLADATAKEKKAEYAHVTPLVVQMHGYEALGKLGGHGTQIYLGDWSKVPQFLYPHAFMGGIPAKPVNAPVKLSPKKEQQPIKKDDDNPYL